MFVSDDEGLSLTVDLPLATAHKMGIELLRRAGFDDAGVVAVERELTPQKERELLCQAHARRFEPKVSKAVGQQWLRRLGIASTPKLEAPLDQDGKLAMKLADNVLATFAEPPQAKAYAFGGKGLLPAVRATLQGKPHLFDLFGDKPAVTPSDEGTKPKTRRLQKVHVSLQARIATDGKASAPIELVRGSWTVADLVGRRLRLQMLPTLKIAQALRAPIADRPVVRAPLV